MSASPVGWANAILDDLIGFDGLFSDGDWVETKDQDPDGNIRLLQLADIGDGVFLHKSNRFVNEQKFEQLRCTEVFEGDVLIARMPDPLGRACLAPKLRTRCITVVDVGIVRPGISSVDPAWLMHTINGPNIREAIDIQSSGTTRRRITRKKLGRLDLPVPPYNEQKRIADKLDAVLARVDACRERLDRVPGILQHFRQAVLAAATSGKLTEDWRGQSDEQVSWNSLSFESLIFEGPKNGLYKPSTVYGDGTRILRIDNFYDGAVISWDKLKRLDVDETERADFGLAVGDIVINRVNSLPYLGKAALIRQLPEPCVFESNMMRIRLRTELIRPEYCILALSSPDGLTQLRVNAKHAVNQASINQTDVRSFSVPLPNLEEQDEIVRRVETLFAYADRLETRYVAARAQVERLTPALLAKAFRGELVPQNPNDEPASVLLERIRAARAAAPAKPARGRKGQPMADAQTLGTS